MRQVFFSFHYMRDVWRASMVRNMGTFGKSAFSGCSGLTTVAFRGNVEFPYGVFYSCQALTTVVAYMENPEPFDRYSYAFDVSSDDYTHYTATLYVPNGCKGLYEQTGICSVTSRS